MHLTDYQTAPQTLRQSWGKLDALNRKIAGRFCEMVKLEIRWRIKSPRGAEGEEITARYSQGLEGLTVFLLFLIQ
jgi:hypothetical protein